MAELSRATANEIIPLPYQNRLLQVRGAGDIEFWEIGDVTNELEYLLSNIPDEIEQRAAVKALRNAVSDVVGVTYKIVVEYQAHALYYPPAVRVKYSALTRWHFRHAKTCGTLKESEKFLRLAVESADEYGGQPMPVRVLQAKIAEVYGKGGNESSLSDKLDTLMATISKLCEKPECSEMLPQLNAAFEDLRQAKVKADAVRQAADRERAKLIPTQSRDERGVKNANTI